MSLPNAQTRYFWDVNHNRYQIQTYNHTTQQWEFSYWGAEQQASVQQSHTYEQPQQQQRQQQQQHQQVAYSPQSQPYSQQAGAHAAQSSYRVDSASYPSISGNAQSSEYYGNAQQSSKEQPYTVAYSVPVYAGSAQTRGVARVPGDYSQTPFSPLPQNPYQTPPNPRDQRRIPRGVGNNVVGTYSGPATLHYEQIDHSFFVRSKPFFHEGRVFAVIMNETAGANAQKPSDAVVDYTTLSIASVGSNSSINRVKYSDNYVYTNKRRFVVVRQKKEFCFACPIFTYGRRATKKPGVRAKEHGIIYSEGRNPQLVTGESGITKSSIGVVMAEDETDLQIASRIYYGIHHPIQYNVKVKDIGHVIPSHVPTLIGNWKEEDDEDTQQDQAITAAAGEEPEYDLEAIPEA